jgi:hypothetical protein
MEEPEKSISEPRMNSIRTISLSRKSLDSPLTPSRTSTILKTRAVSRLRVCAFTRSGVGENRGGSTWGIFKFAPKAPTPQALKPGSVRSSKADWNFLLREVFPSLANVQFSLEALLVCLQDSA